MSYRLYPLFKKLAGCTAVLFIILYIGIAVYRMSYPYELEWLEGGCVDMVRRVLSPDPLYTAPTISYIPFVYAPLYFYVSALSAQLFGIGFMAPRLVSFLASLGCFALLYAIPKRETGSTFAGLLAAGLYAATYVWCGGWFDLARVDSLFVFLLLASIYVLRTGTGRASMLGAAVLLCLSFLTKQSALAIAIPLAVYAILAHRKNGLIFTGAFLGLAAASTLLFDAAYDGWYTYYAFALPGQHPWVMDRVLGFWLTDIMAPLFIALAFAVVLTIGTWRAGDRTRTLFYLALVAGMLGSAWGSRLHEGGYNNVLMPAYAALAILFGIGVVKIPCLVPPGFRLTRNTMSVALVTLSLLQFGTLSYNPLWMIPSTEERAASDTLLRYMQQVEGEVFAPAHGYVPTLAGKRTYAHTVAFWDVLRGDDSVARSRLIGELRELVTSQEFDALVLESPTWVLADLPQYYAFDESLPLGFDSETEMWPSPMKMIRPEGIYVPIPQNADPTT